MPDRRQVVGMFGAAAMAAAVGGAGVIGRSSCAAATARATRTIAWSGFTWDVKDSAGARIGPGGNVFSASRKTVWVDARGRLRLRIDRRGGRWRCAEVIANEPGSFGYGTYAWTLATPPRAVAPHAILGLFTWDNTTDEQANREIDVEIGLWRNDPEGHDALFAVQPTSAAGNAVAFDLQRRAAPITVGFTWRPGEVEFRAARGTLLDPTDPAALIRRWTRATSAVPTPGMEQPRINLWLDDHAPPVAGKPIEVALSSFAFAPLA